MTRSSILNKLNIAEFKLKRHLALMSCTGCVEYNVIIMFRRFEAAERAILRYFTSHRHAGNGFFLCFSM